MKRKEVWKEGKKGETMKKIKEKGRDKSSQVMKEIKLKVRESGRQ